MKMIMKNAKAWIAVVAGYAADAGGDAITATSALAFDLAPEPHFDKGAVSIVAVLLVAFLVWYIPNKDG